MTERRGDLFGKDSRDQSGGKDEEKRERGWPFDEGRNQERIEKSIPESDRQSPVNQLPDIYPDETDDSDE
jgi:hypothetical protein